MKLNERRGNGPLRQATLALLFKNNQILLAMKKRGFGQGRWNGVGGKPKENESIEDTAKRETSEEIGIEIAKFGEIARLCFYFANKPEWNQEVIVYRVDKWTGEPTESEEMAPKWFPFEEIPYESMWPDDKYWLPLVLKGKKVRASFVFGDNGVVEDMEVTEMLL
jgi:8-oxo-dGTP pyrophosphatase MutT (NUDIX family)